jgi:DNA polymerase elongation subunit (family B)
LAQQQSSLELFFEKEKPSEPPKKVARSGIELFQPEVDALQKLRTRIKDLTKEVTTLENSALVSATYDGERRVAVLKFYDTSKDRIYLWSDKSGHKPYCYSKQPELDLKYLLKERSNLERIETVTKYEPLSDKEISVSKIVAKDPLAIGGQETSLRNDLNCWEADIKYYENYLYDNGLVVGAHYSINDGKIEPVPFNMPKEVEESLRRTLASSKPDLATAIKTWASLLNQPLLDIKHAAIDIEVWSLENRIPDPKFAEHPVVAVSIVSRKEKTVYLLKREDLELGNPEKIPGEARVLVFEKERDLLIQVFRDILEYPFLTSFNGDDFDLDYLYHRSLRPEMGIPKDCVPIVLGNNFAGLRHGVHIDLYKTFNNRSLKIYAFANKYSEQTLDGIADGLLGESKIAFEGSINDLPLYELAHYNLQDADLTYRLASIWNEVLMKVLQVIARVGKMPIDDLSRLGVSNWIRSMLYFEHRRQNALIPRPEELKEKGGAKSEAVIKGKKYKGGLVIEPKSGVHFNVSVLDFASLYPSLIKVNNISYETVDCPHPECRSNVIPGIETWTCTKRRGIESLVVGSLRDLRVDYYKQLTKSKTLNKEDKDLYKVVSQGLKVILNACFTGDTDVLTPQGIKNIKELTVGDKVIGVNPYSLIPEIDEIIETQVFPYNDELYCFKNGKQIDLKVTKNHRFFVRQGQKPVTFMEASEIERWTNISIPRLNAPSMVDDDSIISLAPYRGKDKFAVSLPIAVTGRHVDSQFSDLWEFVSKLGAYNKQTKSFFCDELTSDQIRTIRSHGGIVLLTSGHSRYPFEFGKSDFAELCGWLISEGHFGSTPEKTYVNGNHHGLDYRVTITQEHGYGNPRRDIFRGEIAKLLSKMSLRFKQYSHGFRVANPALHRFCVREIKRGAKNKEVPSELLNSSIYVKRRLIDSLYKGDGSLRGLTYTTASPTLADQVSCLMAELGYRPKKVFDQRANVFRVYCSNSSTGLTGHATSEKTQWVTKEKFKGLVYCVTTRKNHTVFAGRNGIFVPVGQSYGVLGFESFPLYCLPAADAVATLGRNAITKTIEKCKELGIDVVYSDTDSLFIQAPSEAQINLVSEWTRSNLGIELDVDKVYRYVAMSQRKKNYFGVLEDGTVDIKGLTGKKSQTPQFIKDSFGYMLDVLSKIKTSDDFEAAREEIKTRLTNDYNRLKNHQIPMEELAFNVMIGKDIAGYRDSIPQHVRAAQQLQKSGKDIRAGDIISFVKTNNADGAKPAKMARANEIDVEKYIEYMRSTFDQILSSLGYDFDEILGATKLEDFFWSAA